ncbi:MAG: hypothetical protein PHS97_07700 [Oscillospiraceae bacterium]|nr:hypothetical protein [Oscillospiraceae bacterium]
MIKRTISLTLIALLLAAAVQGICVAAPEDVAGIYDFSQMTIADAMDVYISEKGLNEENFSVSYENTVTGERYQYNEQTYFIGGSIYKIPLCMLYRDQINRGEMTEDTVMNGWTFAQMEPEILIASNNEMAEYLLRRWPSFRAYRKALGQYCGTPVEDLSEQYYSNNNFCSDYFLGTLEYLYANSDTYAVELDYLKQAMPGAYLKQIDTDCEIAQKYGWFDGAVHAAGIVYTEQPYLMTILTYDLPYAESVIGEVNQIFYDYTLSAIWQPPDETVPAEPVERPEPAPPAAETPTERAPERLPETPLETPPAEETPDYATWPSADNPEKADILPIAFAVAGISAILAIIGLAIHLLTRNKKQKPQ